LQKAAIRVSNHDRCREAYGLDEYGNVRLQDETVCAAVSQFIDIYLSHMSDERRTSTSLRIVPHLRLSGAPSLALLLPFLTSGPDLGAWPDCWVSVEFLHAAISR